MTTEIKAALAEIARQLQEQLTFYRELGVTDIGGAGSATEPATVATFKASPAINPDSAFRPQAEPDISTAAETPSPQVMTQPTTNAADENPREPLVLQREGASGAKPATTVQATRPTSTPPLTKPAASVPPATKSPERPANISLFGDLTPDTGMRAASNVLPVLSSLPPDASLEVIRADLGDCTRCKLSAGRNKIVFGEGNPQAQLMFIGEGPGADEDVTGRPFVGRAGQLLDKIIAAIGRKREEVYIANVVKCRPPGNRTPEGDEVATCEPFLFRQIAVIQPKVIVALGSPAFQCLCRTRETISRARGEFRDWHGIKLMPTFHPAYLLRSPDKKREAWEDLKKVRDYLHTLNE